MNFDTNYTIKVGRRGVAGIDSCLLRKMHQLRAEVFNGRQRWDLPLTNGLEIDSFDNNECVYLICVEHTTKDVVACWRILPTVNDYMLNTVFSELLPESKKIDDPRIWELSRFAVKKSFRGQSPFRASEITRDMFAAIRTFTYQMEVSKFVTVLSPSLHRLLTSSGLDMPQFDNKSNTERRKIGRTACYIELNDSFDKFIEGSERVSKLQYAV